MSAIPILRVARPSDDHRRPAAVLPATASASPSSTASRTMTASTASCWATQSAPYHFEFTRARGHAAGRAPTPGQSRSSSTCPTDGGWQAAVARMRAAGFAAGCRPSTPIGIATGSPSRTPTAIASCFSGPPGPSDWAAPCVPGGRGPHCGRHAKFPIRGLYGNDAAGRRAAGRPRRSRSRTATRPSSPRTCSKPRARCR